MIVAVFILDDLVLIISRFRFSSTSDGPTYVKLPWCANLGARWDLIKCLFKVWLKTYVCADNRTLTILSIKC